MAHDHSGHAPENCKEVFALLSDYLDQDLPAATCEEIRAHLADCPPCIEFLESLKQTVGLCRGYETGERPVPLPEEKRKELAAAYARMLQARKRSG